MTRNTYIYEFESDLKPIKVYVAILKILQEIPPVWNFE